MLRYRWRPSPQYGLIQTRSSYMRALVRHFLQNPGCAQQETRHQPHDLIVQPRPVPEESTALSPHALQLGSGQVLVQLSIDLVLHASRSTAP